MEYRRIDNIETRVSAIGLGTWVMGGWLWGGARDVESEAAIEIAIENGVTLIDTAPVYGFGRAEEVVGRVIKRLGVRDKVAIATKCGLEWDERQENLWRNSTKQRILKELDTSRQRLKTDVIDLYQVHWPDEKTAFSETMETLLHVLNKGWARAIGVSNFNVGQLRQCLDIGPLQTVQPPFNLFDRGIEADLLPFCREHAISVLAYGSICRGLLSGKFQADASFPMDDVRSMDEKFESKNLIKYLAAVERLKAIAEQKNATLAQLASHWVATRSGVTSALVGARDAMQAKENAGAFNFTISSQEARQIEAIVNEETPKALKSKFLGPPQRK